ncbi:MAG TPA: hypothetical protein VK021_11545 [Flavobacteriaceae bacterium]|nr:hypothetical protein [Flavobacteriaceae bacterium]
MKKVFVVLVAFLAFGFAQAQDSGFRIGVHLGLPVSDADKITSLAMGGDLAYLFNVSEEFKAGASLGYLHYSGKKTHGHKREGLGFLPIAATAKYAIIENIFVGADLGYALGLSPSINDGGFYYLPKVGYQIDLFEVYIGYRGIANKFSLEGYSENLDISSVTLGFNYNF